MTASTSVNAADHTRYKSSGVTAPSQCADGYQRDNKRCIAPMRDHVTASRSGFMRCRLQTRLVANISRIRLAHQVAYAADAHGKAAVELRRAAKAIR
jgi:hypothetical protein